MPEAAGQAPAEGGAVDGGDKAYNKLMAAHGRVVTRAEQAERERDELKAQIAERDAELAGHRAMAGQAPADGDDTTTVGDEQAETPDDDEGVYFERRDGKFVPWEPPTPGRHNESRTRDAAGKKEPTSDELRAQLDAMVGKPSKPDWQIG